MKFAPVIVFAYNRPKHLRKTLTYLSANVFADQSDLFIFCDGPKKNSPKEELEKIREVRSVAKEKKWCKRVYVTESSSNKGLSASIEEGVTEVINKTGKAIIIEDDVLVSKYFLEYMNTALNKYEKEDKVMMLAAGFYKTPIPAKGKSFFIHNGTSCAWATWKRAWDNYDPNPKDYHVLKNNKTIKKSFNLDGAIDYTSMLIDTMETKQVNSWAVKFKWALFKNNGLTLFPDGLLNKNIGFDGSGTHSGNKNEKDTNSFKNYKIIYFPDEVKEHKENRKKLVSHLIRNRIKNSFLYRLNKLKTSVTGK